MKKYIDTVSFAKISVLFFMLLATVVNAQTDLPDVPDDNTPAAPINDYVWVLALVGLLFVFLKFKALIKNSNKFIK